MYIGDIIKQYREEHNLSLREFARLSGVTSVYIYNLETINKQTGKRVQPTLNKLQAIAKAMGITLTELARRIEQK